MDTVMGPTDESERGEREQRLRDLAPRIARIGMMVTF